MQDRALETKGGERREWEELVRRVDKVVEDGTWEGKKEKEETGHGEVPEKSRKLERAEARKQQI